jgi:hypothetical protein
MTTPRVTPWRDEEPVDANLLNAIKARRKTDRYATVAAYNMVSRFLVALAIC